MSRRNRDSLKYTRPHQIGRGDYASSFGGKTFDEIAVELGISRNRAWQIYNRALWKLANAFKRAGISADDIKGVSHESMLARAEQWATDANVGTKCSTCLCYRELKDRRTCQRCLERVRGRRARVRKAS